MLKQLDRADIDHLLDSLHTAYRLQIPQQLPDGTRHLSPYTPTSVLSLSGEIVHRKPTSFFFPQVQKLVSIDPTGHARDLQKVEKPLALFGLNRADLMGIQFLDRFFLAAPADDIYLSLRQDALLIGLTGFSGPDKSFLPLSTGNCDIELVALAGHWLALGHSTIGKKLLDPYARGLNSELEELRQRDENSSGDLELLQQASHLLMNDLVPDSFWAEIAGRCILCSGCNMVCPTCSCFCVQDRCFEETTERSRVWDSCQFDAFMREASGHNPLGTEALRTRRRIHHKLAADIERWGEPGCVACGRCDRSCPTGIGMMAVAGEIVKRYGAGRR